MKYLNKILVLFLFTVGLISCDENENFEILPAAEKFEIIAPTTGTVVVLNGDYDTNEGLFIAWESTTAGGSYTIEAALTGTDFASPVEIATTSETKFSMTVAEINAFLLDVLNVPADEAAGIDIRVNGSAGTTSPVSVVFTPYKVEFTEMYLVGSFTNWNPGEALALTNTGFNLFEITVDIPDGGEFKFVPQTTGWDGDWGRDPNNEGSLIVDGEQNLGGYAAGKYKISLDFNTFTYTVDPILSPDQLFLVGSLTGWDPTTSIPFNKIGDNVFTLAIELPDGAEFKFLPTNTGWDGDWGNDPNNNGSIIQDGENNVSGFAGGKYLIKVDYGSLTYTLSPVDNLYLVGSLTGWDPTTSVPMSEAQVGIFTTVIDLPDGAEFKFLPTNTGWDGDWGHDPNGNGNIVQDGESNVSGFGSGLHVITVNFNTLSYTVSSVTEKPSSLFLVGSFRGWSNDGDNPEFTQTSSGVFEITQALSAGDEFKFVPVAGDWGNDWGESQSSPFVLEQNSEKNLKVNEAGTYKITCDFNAGNFKLELQ